MVMNDTVGVHRGSPAQTKITLFRSLFRGREDVYPRRFESLRTGKSGYAPASRLVLELDGSQHLADREAYRRDRRKDALLQEHGYLVLRFLAEDLGTRLDAVLDEVLRALAGRTGRSGTGSGS